MVEPGPLGGKARTLTLSPGWRVETGPHSFTGRAVALRGLALSLGLADRIAPCGVLARSRYLLRGERLRKAGPGLLASWPVLSGLFKRVDDPEDVTVHRWFASRLGAAFADGPLGAMCAGIWATSPDRVDMATGFPLIYAAVRTWGTLASALFHQDRGATGTYSLQGGLGALGEAARSRLGQSGVAEALAEGLAAESGGWTVATARGHMHADAVILAGDAPKSAALLAPIAPEAAACLGQVAYAPLTVAHWIAANAGYPRGFGFLAEPASRIHSLGTLFVSDVLPERAPAGMRSFATMFADATMTDAAVQAALQAEHRTLTGHDLQIEGLHILRHPRAVAAPLPGHMARVAALHRALPPGIALAGSYLGAGAMEDAVRSGREAAARVLAAGV